MILSNDSDPRGLKSNISNEIKPEIEPPLPWLTSGWDTEHRTIEKPLFKPYKAPTTPFYELFTPFPTIRWADLDRFNKEMLESDRIQSELDAMRSIEIDKIDFKPYMPPEPASVHTRPFVGRSFGGAIGGVVVMMLIAKAWGKKGSRNRRGAVQQDLEANVGPPAQGDNPGQITTGQTSGADPPSSDVPPPYSECVNHTVSEQPPSYTNLANHTQPLVHNGLVEAGLRNDCVAMTTTPNNSEDVKTELVFDNGRIVERRSLDLSKEAGQGAKHTDVTDKVVYVDVHSYSKAVLE